FPLFDISGTKYVDADGDGVIDPGEVGLQGVTIFIDLNGNHQVDAGEASTTTDENGHWSLSNLGADQIDGVVQELLPAGYEQTYGEDGYTLDGTDQSNLDFANFELFDISGTKYLDANGDGSTVGDSGLGDVTIFIDINKDGDYDVGIDEATTTASDGTWSFHDLDASYAGLMVYEVVPDGYVQTLGEAGYSITGTSGADQYNMDFANTPEVCYEGLTPGFWKNAQNWSKVELSQDCLDEFGKTDIAGVMTLTIRDAFDLQINGDFQYYQGKALKTIDLDMTLLDALKLNGGVESLFRQGTAALLNSCTTDHQGDQFDFFLSTEQVKDLMQDVISQPLLATHRDAAIELAGDFGALNELEPENSWGDDHVCATTQQLTNLFDNKYSDLLTV
ncbi:hypothetical protein NK718_12305, partial [Alsobacter sp. SYSU M60028]